MAKVYFVIAVAFVFVIAYVSRPLDYIGNYYEINGNWALRTPRGWIMVHDKSVLENSVEAYHKKGIYGKINKPTGGIK